MSINQEYNGRNAVQQAPMQAIVEVITPARAQELLLGNRENRPLRRTWIDEIVGIIQRGEWRMTHQGIAIAPDGRLLDGQHRLAAIVKAGMPVTMVVTYNADPASFLVLDTGMRRSSAFTLGLKNNQIGAIRWLIAMSQHETGANISSIGNTQIEKSLPWTYPPIRKLVQAVNTTRKIASASSIIAGVVMRMHISDDPESVAQQYRAFILLEYAAMAPPLHTLERQISNGLTTVKMPKILMIKAFKAFDPSPTTNNLQWKDETLQLKRLHEIALSMSRTGSTLAV